MSQKKRILILSASYGQGHNAVGRAVEAALAQNGGNQVEITFVDLANELRRYSNQAFVKAYERTTRYTPKLYGLIFQATDNPYSTKLLNNLITSFNYLRLKKYLAEQKPDIIINLFPIWLHLIKVIFKADKKPFLFINILTDSTLIHSSWIDNYADYFIVADKDTAKASAEQGAHQDKIKILGYPLAPAYKSLPDKTEARLLLGLKSKKDFVLYMASGDHVLLARQTVTLLAKMDQNVVVICGRNKRLFGILSKLCKKYNNIHILGWTDQVPLYIAASDVVLTKAGGATVMECIAAHKPVIINRIIPGQEEGNAKLIQKYRLGKVVTDTNNLSQSISKVLKNSKQYQKRLEQYQADPEAAEKVADFILDLPN